MHAMVCCYGVFTLAAIFLLVGIEVLVLIRLIVGIFSVLFKFNQICFENGYDVPKCNVCFIYNCSARNLRSIARYFKEYVRSAW